MCQQRPLSVKSKTNFKLAKTQKKKTIICVYGDTSGWVITADLLRIQMRLDGYMENDKIRI